VTCAFRVKIAFPTRQQQTEITKPVDSFVFSV
jgi:hypothetical protein